MEKLMEILSSIRPDVDFEKEKSLVDDGILDSFDVVSIVAEITDTFDVDVSADYIVPENFNSAEAMWNFISNLLDE